MGIGALSLSLIACSGSSRSASGPPQPIAESDASVPLPSDATIETQGLSASDCEVIFEKVFRLAYEQQTQSVPAEAQPTPEDKAVAKAKLRDEFFAACVGAAPELFAYNCVKAAEDKDAIEACRGVDTAN